MGGQYRKMKNMSELFKRGKFCKKKNSVIVFKYMGNSLKNLL